MSEPWQKLRVGDRIRLVAIPPEWDQLGYYVHAELLQIYHRLIARGRSLRIVELDDWGAPWVRFRFRKSSGGWEHHFLSITEGGWVLVRTRSTQG